MKLSLEATPQELEDKSGDLIKAVADILVPVAPEAADAMLKALPHKEQALKFPVLRNLQGQTEALYGKMTAAMLKDISAVLDRGLKKGEDQPEKIHDHTKPIADHDGVAYERVKQVLVGKGYDAADFDEGGVLFGYSTNQLIDLARDKRASK